MRKALIALMASGALAAVAVPALAQSYDPGVAQREQNIRERIDDNLQNGDLSPGQASRLRGELREIVDLDARYQDDGMSDWQAQDLNSRLSLLGVAREPRSQHEPGLQRLLISVWPDRRPPFLADGRPSARPARRCVATGGLFRVALSL